MSDQYTIDDHEDQVVLRSAWEQVVRQLEGQLPETVIKKFLKPLSPVGYDQETATLAAPGQFIQEWVREKYLDLLQSTLSGILGHSVRLVLQANPRERVSDPEDQGVVTRQPISIDPSQEFKTSSKYRFDNYVVGQSNRLAHAGAKAVAAQPGTKYNPLFIYGASGLGKTHLMHAIAHEIHRRDARHSVMYVSAQQFAEEFVMALQNNRIDQFRKAQRSVQVWLLDDVQFIAGKERTQEEIFHTFNFLHSLGKQIVLCSDRPPRDLLLMDERLRSRFESGLVADIMMPDTETRCAILQSKAEQENVDLPHDVAMYLAESIPSNVRILEGALTKVAAQASLEDTEITYDLACQIVNKHYQAVGLTKPSFEQILESVSKHFQISVADIRGLSRKAPIAHARHVAVFITREITRDSWKHIGALFGNRDHTSMMHGYRKIRELMNRDKELTSSVQSLIRDLYPEV